jgi:hypothetical protein
LLAAPLSLPNGQPDLSEVEHEYVHLGFIGACDEKRQIVGVHALLQQETLIIKWLIIMHMFFVLALNDHVVHS